MVSRILSLDSRAAQEIWGVMMQFLALRRGSVSYTHLPALFTDSIRLLCQIIREQYRVPPLLLIDEYDQPVMSSYEYGYHDSVGNFFSNLFGSAMKGNPDLGQALLTGVQRVAKESIFSQFNNVRVYTVLRCV